MIPKPQVAMATVATGQTVIKSAPACKPRQRISPLPIVRQARLPTPPRMTV
jgi:hypothetical protein